MPGADDASLQLHDCGCGTGMSGEELHKAGLRSILGSDCSAESLKVAMEKQCGPDSDATIYACKVVNLEKPLPFGDNVFYATTCVGTTSYISHMEQLFREWIRTTRKGGVICWTHRTTLFDEPRPVDGTHGMEQVDGLSPRDVCTKLEGEGLWKLLLRTDKEVYMPNNPDPAEAGKTVYYSCYEVL